MALLMIYNYLLETINKDFKKAFNPDYSVLPKWVPKTFYGGG